MNSESNIFDKTVKYITKKKRTVSSINGAEEAGSTCNRVKLHLSFIRFKNQLNIVRLTCNSQNYHTTRRKHKENTARVTLVRMKIFLDKFSKA